MFDDDDVAGPVGPRGHDEHLIAGQQRRRHRGALDRHTGGPVPEERPAGGADHRDGRGGAGTPIRPRR